MFLLRHLQYPTAISDANAYQSHQLKQSLLLQLHFLYTTPEEMERIIKDSEKKKEKDNSYFVWGTLIIMGVLIGCAVLLWAIFFNG